MPYACPWRAIEFSSKVREFDPSKCAPGGTSVLLTNRPGIEPTRTSMRELSIPFSCTRYCRALSARSAPASGCSFAEEFPTTTSFAPACCCMVSAMSSRQPFASLSTRTGRRWSRSKLMWQRSCVSATIGVGGMVSVNLGVCLCCLAKIVDDVASDGDCGSGESRGREFRCRPGRRNLARAGCVGVRERTILRACSCCADVDDRARRRA